MTVSKGNTDTAANVLIENRRSLVRVVVTYGATLYLFGGILALVFVVGVDSSSFDKARDLYMVGAPVASGVIGYWFATRSAKKKDDANS